MKPYSTPVKPAGQTGDKEVELAQKRLARRKAAYEKLCASIERRQRKLDKDQRSVERGVKALAKLERQRSRWRKLVERLEREVGDALVASTVEEQRREPESPPPSLSQGSPASDGPGNVEENATPPDNVKPKRKRKLRTVGQAVADILGETLNPPRPRGKARLAHLAQDLPAAAREAGEDQGIFPKPKLDLESGDGREKFRNAMAQSMARGAAHNPVAKKLSAAERDARMESMGFRKTTRKR